MLRVQKFRNFTVKSYNGFLIKRLKKALNLLHYNGAVTWENRSSGFPTRSDTNRAAQLLNMARGLKFRIYEVEGLYYPCSENKDTDQLRGYRKADLRLCIRICKNPVFSRRGSMHTGWKLQINTQTFRIFILFETQKRFILSIQQ